MVKITKSFEGELRKHMIRLPEVIDKAPGIAIFGKRIKSLLFSTDVAVIRNTNADAITYTPPTGAEILRKIMEKYRM